MNTIKIRRKLKSTLLKIKELEEYKGKNVELEIKVNEIEQVSKDKKQISFDGIFSKYADINLIKNEKSAWISAVRDKHDNYRR